MTKIAPPPTRPDQKTVTKKREEKKGKSGWGKREGAKVHRMAYPTPVVSLGSDQRKKKK